MKKMIFSGIALFAIATVTYANDVEETKTTDVNAAKALPVGNCIGKFTVKDGKGTVIFTKTVETTEASEGDCNKVMDAAQGIYEAYWGTGYTVTHTTNYIAK